MLKMDDIEVVKKTKNQFKISWKMTDWCNYRCPYCYMSNAIARTNKNTPFEKILEIASKIDELIKKQAKGRKISLHLIGGEVGYYDLQKVFEKIKSNIQMVVIATNFSNKEEYWFSLKKYLSMRNTRCNIIASFHISQCNPEEFCKKVINVGAKVKVVLNNQNIPIYKPYLDYLIDNQIVVQPTIERDDKNSCIKLTSENRMYVDFLNKKLNETTTPYFEVTLKNGSIVNFGSNIEFINSIDIGGFDSEGFECTAGIDGIRIRPDGGLQRAGCKMAFLHGQLGNILSEYTLPTEPFICTSKYFENGIEKIKYCTAFSNASMRRYHEN